MTSVLHSLFLLFYFNISGSGRNMAEVCGLLFESCKTTERRLFLSITYETGARNGAGLGREKILSAPNLTLHPTYPQRGSYRRKANPFPTNGPILSFIPSANRLKRAILDYYRFTLTRLYIR